MHLTIEIDPSTIFQNIIGFGGAITDAVGVNLAALSKETQNNLIKQYYGPSGEYHTSNCDGDYLNTSIRTLIHSVWRVDGERIILRAT